MRLVVARCSVDYAGRLSAHLPEAVRVLMVKADGSVLVHADGGSYKPLNWMSPPCALYEETIEESLVWTVTNKAGETLIIRLHEVVHDSEHDLGVDPGLVKDGVELMNRDALLAPVAGVLAAQEIKPQARVLAEDRGIRCVVVDYDSLRGTEDPSLRLF